MVVGVSCWLQMPLLSSRVFKLGYQLSPIVTHAGAVDEQGMYTDTEDIDCLVCKCDMWLYAVVSPSCPDQAACTEHAQHLDCSRSEQILLYRCVSSISTQALLLGLAMHIELHVLQHWQELRCLCSTLRMENSTC